MSFSSLPQELVNHLAYFVGENENDEYNRKLLPANHFLIAVALFTEDV